MSSSTVNMVKYFFHARHRPAGSRLQQYVALAYQAARDQQLYPSEVFIRSDVHSTTTENGRVVKDAPHVTISYKTRDSAGRQSHVTCHAYVTDMNSLAFKSATHTNEKPDSTKVKRPGKEPKAVWPSRDQLWEAPEVGYGHI